MIDKNISANAMRIDKNFR